MKIEQIWSAEKCKSKRETLKKELFDDPTWSVLIDTQYPLKVSRYNYLVMKEINSLLKLDES